MARRKPRKVNYDRLLRAEARGRLGEGRPARVVRLGGWLVCAAGVGLFAASYVASLAGARLLPFDPHHIIGQAGGVLLAFGGLRLATR